MGKNKKKVTHTKKEEEQAKRVIKIISISLCHFGTCHDYRFFFRELKSRFYN